MADSGTGRWVKTFASDVEAGDRIRTDGRTERVVVGRDYPPSYRAAFRIDFSTGPEGIRKTDLVEIWDSDGSVSQRVMDISARGLQ